MEYTFQEKIAVMRILLDIIHADGIIDARETFFFNKLKEEFNLTDEDHELVKSKNSLIALTQIKLMTEDQKTDFARLMSEMIIVDGDINTNEVSIYEVVADFCGIKVPFEDATDNEQIAGCTRS
ncbi:hypothetical protein [uncultured Bacteroides sp.]|uniref:hypothetical protein n=1 Tax=uncultured Bacteroides sp. TaxID=162156 RepID=UPI0026160861|nr:hypothetical protein [uncultured Bacteroides sp.]